MKAIIVEDEFPAREELKFFIGKFSSIEVVCEFDNGVDVLRFLQESFVDVVFLDINVPLLDGMVLARTVSQFRVKPRIVFISAYREYAVDAFELDAFDYVLKPYSEERIVSTLRKLEESVVDRVDEGLDFKFGVWDDDRLVFIDKRDIYFIEACERETFVFTKDKRFLLKCSVSEAFSGIGLDSFFKCHRSFAVNLSFVTEVIPWFNHTFMLRLKESCYEVPVSRSNVPSFKKVMHLM